MQNQLVSDMLVWCSITAMLADIYPGSSYGSRACAGTHGPRRECAGYDHQIHQEPII